MKPSYLRSISLMFIIALLVASCSTASIIAEVIDSIHIYCDHVVINYSSIDFSTDYTVQAFLADGTPASDLVSGDVVGSGSIRINLNQRYPAGTQIYLTIDSSSLLSPYESSPEPCQEIPQAWFDPGDDRINRQAYARAAVYCDDANSRVAIYGVDEEGEGFPAIFVPYADLPATPAEADGHTLIAQYENIGFYRLTTGEYQINAGPDGEGKSYVVIWDGCPHTYLNSYTLQNGVMTPAELN